MLTRLLKTHLRPYRGALALIVVAPGDTDDGHA